MGNAQASVERVEVQEANIFWLMRVIARESLGPVIVIAFFVVILVIFTISIKIKLVQ
jgi:hypothetical protein